MNIEAKLIILKNKWIYNTRGISSSTVIENNKYYKKIINLGFSALPFLIKEQELKTGRYYFAIKKISSISYLELKKNYYFGNLNH